MSEKNTEKLKEDLKQEDSFNISEEGRHHAEEAAKENLKDAAEAQIDHNEEVESAENEISLEELQKELEEAKDQVVRLMADNQNIRRRAEADRYRQFEESRNKYVGLFLPIFDDLTRSLEMSEKFEVPEGFMEGMRMVAKKFEDLFEKENVERIDETMVPFDVELHEAMMRQPASDESIEPGTVLQVFEPGYRIGGRVIKHAKVIVSQ